MLSYALMVLFSGGGALRDANGNASLVVNYTYNVSEISTCNTATGCEFGLHNSYSVSYISTEYDFYEFFNILLNVIFNIVVLGDATDVGVGTPYLRRMLGGNFVHGSHEPAICTPAYPGARRGPHLPRTHFLLQTLWQARRALSWIRSHFLRVAYIPVNRLLSQ